MSETQVILKSIACLRRESAHFTVNAYQRGFRWTRTEVRDLLDDVLAFSAAYSKEPDAFYCLQPVVITPSAEESGWHVIDGQQRLTVLYLFYCCYAWMVPPNDRYNLLPFSVAYMGKPRLQTCLESIKEKEYISAGKFAAEMAEYDDDIDCHYLLEAYQCIGDRLQGLLKSPYARAELRTLKDTFDTRVKVIWYEVRDLSPAEETVLFIRLNTGRIALTDAELIRALLLERRDPKCIRADSGKESSSALPKNRPEDSALQRRVAAQWGEMERRFGDPQFWNFLTGGEAREGSGPDSTRMDLLFRVMALELNRGVLADAEKRYPEDAPWAVSETANPERLSFYVFSAWQRLLRKTRESDAGAAQDLGCADGRETIWEEVRAYYGMFLRWYEDLRVYHRAGLLLTAFPGRAPERVLELVRLYRETESGTGEGQDQCCGEPFSEKLLRLISRKLFGVDRMTASECREWVTGLLYPRDAQKIRQALLIYNLALLETMEPEGRFPFEAYRSGGRLNWDLEHINATGGAEEPEHSIGNLTLLDGAINRAYRNDAYALKQKAIRKRSAEGVYIPPGTWRVFAKNFPGAADLTHWEETDRKAYTDELIALLCSFLKLEESVDGN